MLKKLLRLSSWLVISQLILKIFAFGYSLFLARSLGVDEFGLYTYALALFLLLNVLSDLGLSRFLIKEQSNSHEIKQSVLVNVMVLRALVLSGLVVIAGLLLSIFENQTARTGLTLIAIASLVPQALTLSFENLLIARQKFNLTAITSIFSNLTTIVIGVLFVIGGYQAFGAVLALFLSQILYCLVWLWIVRVRLRDFKLKLVEWSQLKRILIGAMPYGLISIIGFIYFRIDAVLLTYLRGPYETGLYGLGYKFLEGVVFIPSSLALTIFPSLVIWHQKQAAEIRRFSQRLILVMGGLGVVISGIFIYLLPMLINNFLPAYQSAVVTIQILALAIPAMFIHVPLSQVLLASDKYLKSIILMSLIPVTLNVILNLIYIPQYGYIAAAWVTVLSDWVSLILLLMVLSRTIFLGNAKDDR